MRLLLLLVFVGLNGAAVSADEIGGRVLLPNGKPAEYAKVIARFIDSGRSSDDFWNLQQREFTTETDLLGFFDATVPEITLTAGPGRTMRPYLLIDAPGCALHFMILTDVKKRDGEARTIIQLKPNFTFEGTVLGPNLQPVSGARVKVFHWGWGISDSSPLNYRTQIQTPQLITQTNRSGKFALRGISVPDYLDSQFPTSGSISISAMIDGQPWTMNGYLAADVKPAKAAKRNLREFILQPTVTFSGRVLDAETGKPFSDIQVRALPRSLDFSSSVRTSADGTFKVTALSPAKASLYLTQTLTSADGKVKTISRSYQIENKDIKDQKINGPRWIKNLKIYWL